MLEYCKIILSRMSFNQLLFKKEYRKTFSYLDVQEHVQLKEWLRQKEKGNFREHANDQRGE